MATEVLVSNVISEEMIGAGKALFAQLDKSNWPVLAALWFLDTESQRWKLLLASPKVEAGGPKKAYITISMLLRSSRGMRRELLSKT